MIQEAIVKIVNKEDLTYEEAYSVMNEIMERRDHPDAERCLSGGSLHQKHQGGNHT